MTSFSTAESAALERDVEILEENLLDLSSVWTESNRHLCRDWVNEHKFSKVCLQFPDSYLTFSTVIVDDLKVLCDSSRFYIMADTSYGSCCVDEIAASHVDADSIIHFGTACKSKVSRLPVLYIFPQYSMNLQSFTEKSKDFEDPTVIVDIGYHHKVGPTSDYLKYPFDNDYKIRETYDECIFVGSDNERFFSVSATIKASKWYIYDPRTEELKEKNPLLANYIRRRYFSIEKCKDAQMVGLVVATLSAEGYLDIIDHIKAMAKSRGIKTQIISVGRINPAKLANFLEIDCFVLIGCPFNNLYTSRDFYKPIVSVFEAEMAFNPAWYLKYPEIYSTDFKDVLPNGRQFNEFHEKDVKGNDVSLVSGRLRGFDHDNSNCEIGNAIVKQDNMAIMEQRSGLQFEDRSWKGLEPALGRTEPAKIEKGLSGIPMKYVHD